MTEIPIYNLEPARREKFIPKWTAFVGALALLTTVGLLVLTLVFMVSFKLGDMMARTNPFNNYELVWPGQTLADVAEYARQTSKGHVTCYSNTLEINPYPGSLLMMIPNSESRYTSENSMTCMDALEKSTFRSVSITIQNNRVQELNLFSDFLQQDVLSLYWGAPDAISKSQNGQAVYLHWDRSAYTASAMLNKPYLVVNLVTLTAK
ncbi:MAG: hypothetical protein ABI690_00120 [Chloroflexota bacterium]